MNHVIYITGVSGVGKSTVGERLAAQLGYTFLDGDDYHPASNIEKMSASISLTDHDRWPWLDAIVDAVNLQSSTGVVVACSALKQAYRDRLSASVNARIEWVHLHGDKDLIYRRMTSRKGHFMPPAMLDAQIATYEMPTSGRMIAVTATVDEIVDEVVDYMTLLEVGLIGLGVMGTSLARNLGRNNFRLAIYNRHVDEVEVDVARRKKVEYEELTQAAAFDNLEQFVASLSTPRKIILMVNAGAAVDAVIDQLTPLLQQDDIIIDGGNSLYSDTQRRFDVLAEQGIRFIGSGVSGGELGALMGPSIMPGGSISAYVASAYLLEAIAAKTTDDQPCCQFIGAGGAGHFVKMVHNGIEYGEMQLLAEVYGILRYQVNYSPSVIATILNNWKTHGEDSYLLDITIDILRTIKDDGQLLLDLILDKAGNKGTGSWTTIAACELGVPIPTMTAALFARYQSAMKEDRLALARHHHIGQADKQSIDLDQLRSLYRLSRLVNHRQGFHLISAASDLYNWDVSLPALAQVWSAGCIIQSDLLRHIGQSMTDYDDLLYAPSIVDTLQQCYPLAALIAGQLAVGDVPTPCLLASIDYYRTACTPVTTAQLIQAQRDFFGAHTFKWIDDPHGPSTHHHWQKG